jgi:hypothetical protein
LHTIGFAVYAGSLEAVGHCSKCSGVLKVCLFCDSIIRAASRRSRSETTL